MLDALLDALRDAGDGHLRDFAAKYLMEFLWWSLLHSRSTESLLKKRREEKGEEKRKWCDKDEMNKESE